MTMHHALHVLEAPEDKIRGRVEKTRGEDGEKKRGEKRRGWMKRGEERGIASAKTM